MPDRHEFRILPKENALFLDDEHSAPKQRSFKPPKGDAMGRFPQPIPLAPPKREAPTDGRVSAARGDGR